MIKKSKVLITCPPMLGIVNQFLPLFNENGWEVTTPQVLQTLSEEELIALIPYHDGWIIGDDPASRRVFEAGKLGRLRAAVKWGIGVDNVDFKACGDLNIPVDNTPGMFGGEVADLAVGYVIGLARQTYFIDRAVRAGKWVKPAGISLAGRVAAVVGLGDIGRSLVRRLRAADMSIVGYDPGLLKGDLPDDIRHEVWPTGIESADFLILTCPLTQSSHHMVNRALFSKVKPGLRIVNVSRGPIIDELALIEALDQQVVHSAALDVFEEEPLSKNSPLRGHKLCIFGSHNASNTIDAVARTSEIAIQKLTSMLVSG
jgi:D-3-phosphoglycerate dehydrogenase